MKQRARIYYSSEQKNLMWDRWQADDGKPKISGPLILLLNSDRSRQVVRKIEPFLGTGKVTCSSAATIARSRLSLSATRVT